ncbi:MAG TPA: phage baseplate assembly protein V [Acidimicrobiales bacterium]|nr:phage baseplate assembly protein V [Acidimicrobiales bacterium]
MPDQPHLTPVVKLNGSALTKEWVDALIELRVELQFQVPARVTLRFSDPDYELVGGVKIRDEVKVASPQSPNDAFVSAEVTSVAVEQREGNRPELVLVAMDKSYRLGQTTNAQSFVNMKYSDIVTKLVGDAGLSAVTDATSDVYEYATQAGSDLALITELAHRTGYDWWVSGTEFHFKKPAKGPEVKLGLTTGLRSFSARASGLRPDKVTVAGWDRVQQAELKAQAETPGAPRASSDLADKVEQYGYGFFVGGLGVENQSEAQQLAQALVDRGATAAVTAKGVADGNSNIALGATVVVENAGPLNGHYPVTAVEHLFRPVSGFVTRFTSGERRPTTLVDALGATVASRQGSYLGSGSFARSGLAVAVVTSNDDKDKAGRVKVKFTGPGSDIESGWARVLAVGGGKNRGSVWIPEVGDEVLVAFENGNARAPVVIGGLYGQKDAMPLTEVKDGKVQSRALTSRTGHVIAMFDGDTDKELAIEMALEGKQHKIRLGKDALNVQVPSGKPVTIAAGDTKIEFSQSGDVTISGPNITLKGQQSVKIQAPQISVAAQATLDLKADAEAKLSGAVLDMKGSGAAKLAGGVVQIN